MVDLVRKLDRSVHLQDSSGNRWWLINSMSQDLKMGFNDRALFSYSIIRDNIQ